MNLNLTPQDHTDLKRAVIIAMQTLDATNNHQDIALANRLQAIDLDQPQKTSDLINQAITNTRSAELADMLWKAMKFAALLEIQADIAATRKNHEN